jgi:hypothetical protein
MVLLSVMQMSLLRAHGEGQFDLSDGNKSENQPVHFPEEAVKKEYDEQF